VKPSDVAIYVEHGAADLGVVGKDILLEQSPDVYELLDLGVGKCRVCVAAKKGFRDDLDRTLRVATKFPGIAPDFYAGQGREIDVIKLNGSIELAPILGLSDVIVDIVETGTTLKENDPGDRRGRRVRERPAHLLTRSASSSSTRRSAPYAGRSPTLVKEGQ
jgi:ATP phosphoribosyltransferase